MHPKDYLVHFTGNYGELKRLGFQFQKLYAANYQQWNMEDIRVWRKGQDVTHDSWGHKFPTILNTLVKLDINNLPFEKSEYFKNVFWLKLYVNSATFECTTDATQFWAEKKTIYDAVHRDSDTIPDQTWSEIVISPESLKPLQILFNKGWISIEKN